MPSDRTMPAFPEFADAGADRAYRRQRLAAACRIYGQFGFDGPATLLSARDPEQLDHAWVAPVGAALRQVTVGDLVLVPGTDASALHAAIYAARPDVAGIAELAPTHSRTFSSQRRLLAPITQDACAFHGQHAVASGNDDNAVLTALGDHKAVLIPDRGHLTVGGTVDAAAWWGITMERTCQAQLLAEAAGTPVPIVPDVAEETARLVGPPIAGWRAFQPLYAWITAQQPELLTYT